MTTCRLLESRVPIVAAPMAGGAGGVALGAAVAVAGAFPFLAGGYQSDETLASQVDAARSWGVPFGVNVFGPGGIASDATAFADYAARLQPEAEVYGLRLDPVPHSDDDGLREKVALLVADPVPVVSFTFGLPPRADIVRLRRAGSIVLATVTTADEAAAAAAAGVDGLVVQGPRAGGHSATWDPRRPLRDRATASLVAEVRTMTALPLIAAGGVDGPAAVQELLAAGAQGVAVGTLLLVADEAGTSATHRDALVTRRDATTVVTAAFTGRPARAVRNGFIARHDAVAPLGYPAVHHLTRELRRHAAAAGDADRVHLWAGTGYARAEAGPAGAIVRALAARL